MITTKKEMVENGYYKITKNSGFGYITALFYNPMTKELMDVCVKDLDDPRNDNEELYNMEVNEKVYELYKHHRGIVSIGDTIEVIKGRKVPVGTIGKVVNEFDYKDQYGRVQAHYFVLEDGTKINEMNCKLIWKDGE